MNRPVMKSLSAKVAAGLVAGAALVGVATAAWAAGAGPVPPKQEWAHGGVNTFTAFTKTFDRASLQRGFQVYKEVCSSCHSMKHLSYRNLSALGFSEEEVKAIAAGYTVMAGPNDDGEMFERPAIPADRFKSPFANDKAAAAANGGKAPPDLSLIVKARQYHEDYIYALLIGYKDAPEGFKVPDGGNYNEYYPGHVIAMAQPIYDDGVTYADGTKATVAQQAHDVTSFLAWAAEPKLEERRQLGIKVMMFLAFLSVLLYLGKRAIWRDAH